MIDTSTLATLKNSREKLIVLYLATAYRPMRLHEISKAIGVHRNRCGESLKILVEAGFITQFDEFDTTFYCLEAAPAQPQGTAEGASQPPPFSPLCVESADSLESINVTYEQYN